MMSNTPLKIQGTLRVPSDKSLTHRALLFASIAQTPSLILNPLMGGDPKSTVHCLRLLGHEIDFEDAEVPRLEVRPALKWTQPSQPLDCGNSGTTARLLSGLLASRGFTSRLIGDESLSRRPMKRIQTPLEMMGARFEGDHLPMTILGSDCLKGIKYASPIASAQVKSAVLLAGLRAESQTSVTEPSLSRDHTERMLRSLGVDVETIIFGDGHAEAIINPCEEIRGFSFSPPADISSAAFWMVASSICPGSEICLEEVGLNPTRTGVLDVLNQCGVDFEILNRRNHLGEPSGTVVVRYSEQLKPFVIEGDLVARLIDEIPILCILATQAKGESVIRDASELRVKESDRIDRMATGLRSMGAKVETFEDGLVIEGPTPLVSSVIQASGDHRIAMAFAIANLLAGNADENDLKMRIIGSETISTSYPAFWKDYRNLIHG